MTPRRFDRIQRRLALKDKLADKLGPEVLKMGRRAIRRALSTNGSGSTLARVNEGLAAKNLTLHPTKGYRPISALRTIVSIITFGMKNRLPGDYSTEGIRNALRRKAA